MRADHLVTLARRPFESPPFQHPNSSIASRHSPHDLQEDLRRFDETGTNNVRYTTFHRQTGATPSGDVASASELSAANHCRAGA